MIHIINILIIADIVTRNRVYDMKLINSTVYRLYIEYAI